MAIIINSGGLKLFQMAAEPPEPTYDITSTTALTDEGTSVMFVFTTTGPDGMFYWTNSGTTSFSDFSDGSNMGSFSTSGGTGIITRTLINDESTEGEETIVFEVRTVSPGGAIVASTTVVINDSSTTPAAMVPDWTVGEGGNFATLSDAMSSASVIAGDYIRVLPGTYTMSSMLTINKPVYIGGTPGIKGDVVLQSAGAGTDPVTLITVSANNVLLKDLTIKHRKTTNTSIETAVALTRSESGVNVRVDGFIMDSCRIEHVEFGLVVRGNGFKVANNEIAYAGPSNSTRRHVGLYGTGGTCFFTNNAFEDSTAAGVTGNTNIFYLTSTTGLVASEKFTGMLVVDGSTWVSSTSKQPNQFFNQDNCQSDGTFSLMFKNNVVNEKNVFVSLYGSTNNFGDVFGDITFANNTLSNSHNGTSVIGGKGMLAIDGGGSNVSFRSAALTAFYIGNTINMTGNTIGNSTFRPDYTSVFTAEWSEYLSSVGRKTAAIAPFSVYPDNYIAPTPVAPATPDLAA